jgi:hypothetical protein
MLGRRRKPRVLARAPVGGSAGDGTVSLDGDGLRAYSGALTELDDSAPVLVTGDAERAEVALGLASASTALGRRTVLLECDLGRPALAAALGLVPAPGLADYLTNEAEPPQILQAAILAGPATAAAVAPLVCIVAGLPTELGPVLLASAGFHHAVAKLRTAYESVVMLGPGLDDEASLVRAAMVAGPVVSASGTRLPRRLRNLVDGVIEPIARR